MSSQIEQISNHRVFKSIESLERLLSVSADFSNADLDVIEAKEKAKAIITYIQQRISQSDPLLTPTSVLNNIDDALVSAAHNITVYYQNENFGHLVNALALLDSCCIQVTQIPSHNSDTIDGIFKTATEFRSSVAKLFLSIKQEMGELSKKQEDLGGKIYDASVEIGQQKARLDSAIAAYQQQFADSQQTRQSEFSASEQSRQAIAQSSEEARQLSFETIRQQHIDEFTHLNSLAQKTHTDLVDELKGAAANSLAIIETQKDHVQKLVGIITNTGMAYGFQKTANEEHKQAFIWSIVAVVALITWITAGCIFFAFTYDKELTLPSVIRQFLISTPFVLLSGFAAMRVAQHQKNERLMRKSELEIASIDPFLATLSDQDRNEVKREFATRYFGQKDAQEKHEPVPSNLVELAGSLVKVVQDLTKKN
jgi:branched-subunit amino acid transport protein/formiminotetrahydrofolate cyclodeaminase